MEVGELLERDNTIRIVYGARWLTFDIFDGFVVREKKKYAHNVKTLIITGDENYAIDALLNNLK